MTEEEARSKVCHRTLATGADIARFSTGARCLASQCMAWRWHTGRRTQAFRHLVRAHMQTQAKPNTGNASNAVYAEHGDVFEHTEGYCGLAGAPL